MESAVMVKQTTEIDNLWKQYRITRKEDLREKLVLHHIPLVKYVIGRMFSHLPSEVSREDLINSGILGLISAVERFEPDRQIKFGTFAIPRIKGAILDELRTYDFFPRSVRYKMRQVQNTINELEGKLKRSPTEEEIAAGLNVTIEEYRNILRNISPICFFSLSDKVDVLGVGEKQKESVYSLSGHENPAGHTEKQEIRSVLIDAIQKLPRNERLMVALYYYEEMTMKEIAVVLKVSESRVSQIHTQAILRLRTALENAFK